VHTQVPVTLYCFAVEHNKSATLGDLVIAQPLDMLCYRFMFMEHLRGVMLFGIQGIIIMLRLKLEICDSGL
jgi:hypothetical protein